jgi:hypothetical protein
MVEKSTVAIILSSVALAGVTGLIVWELLLRRPGTSVGGTAGIPSFSINVGGSMQ